MNLEVKVAANGDRVAGLPHRAHSFAGEDAVAAVDWGRSGQVGVEVGAVLGFAVDQEVVAVEGWVVAGAEDFAVADGDQGCATGGDYVEALVGAIATAGGAEFAYVAAGAVGALDGEGVVLVGETAVGGEAGGGECGKGR